MSHGTRGIRYTVKTRTVQYNNLQKVEMLNLIVELNDYEESYTVEYTEDEGMSTL